MSDPFSTALPMTPAEVLDMLEKSLGISEDELAQALNSNRRTLQRWRAGTAYPQRQARQRLAQLLSLHERVRGAVKGRGAVRKWFHSECSYLGGITPAEAIRVGRLDRVEAALEALNLGALLNNPRTSE
jgi:transcriptional regulator with XRE-family HTH domain